MIKYFNNKRINLNVNVNNYNTVSEEVLTKLNTVSGNIQTLNSNMENILSGNYFDNKFKEKFSVNDYEKLLNVIENNNYNALTGYINAYNDFDSFMNILKNIDNTLMNYVFNECEAELPSAPSAEMKYAIISGAAINIRDANDEDFDEETVYKFDVPGFVLRVEVYTNSTSKFTEGFLTKLSYNSETETSTIYITEEDYENIYNLQPNNKLKIVYLSKV